MEKLFVYLTSIDSSNIAYLIVFGILVACGLGFPLPEDVPLIASGYLVWEGTMTWVMAFAVTLVGVMAGDTVLFYFGQKLGLKILYPSGGNKSLFNPRKVRRVRAYFRKYGDKIVFFARFLVGFRAVAFFMAGAMRMRYTRFILLDMAAALLSVPLWILTGYGFGHYFGVEISRIFKEMKHFKHGMLALTFFVVLFVVTRFVLKYRRAQVKKNNLSEKNGNKKRPR